MPLAWHQCLWLGLERMFVHHRAEIEREATRRGVSPQTIVQRCFRLGLSRLKSQTKYQAKRKEK